MCGIAGELSFDRPPDQGAMSAMLAKQRHRGPDAEGRWSEGPALLGFRRLAIIDLDPRSNQPMHDPTGRYVLVFNGEIYNFLELKAELEALGERFRTSGDGEVLLAAYGRWGERCLSRLDGMFALAIYDRREQTLFAARDRFGEKPFYYAPLPGGGVAFASELSALRLHPLVAQDLDPAALSTYLACGYTVGERTILSAVKRLPPASFVRFARGRAPEIVRYWDLAGEMRKPCPASSPAEAEEALRALFDESVRRRMISDVPLGAFLSGGVDSSAITSSMIRGRDPTSVKTFTIDFAERSYSEASEAQTVADHLGVHHRARTVTPNIVGDIEQILLDADEPFADSSIIPTHYLARFAREHVTVSLSGDGGDELFAGYDTYDADRLHRLIRAAPILIPPARAAVAALMPVTRDKIGLDYKARQFVAGAALDPVAAHWFWRNMFDADARRRALRDGWDAGEDGGLAEARARQAEVADLTPLQQAAYVDIKTWLCDDILVKVDRATMAASLESRAPFLDHRVAELALQLPDDWKIGWTGKKRILKRAVADRLPPGILSRKKRGFNAPVSHWIADELREPFLDNVRAGRAADVVDPAFAEQLLEQHVSRRADHGYRLFNLMALSVWLNHAPQAASVEGYRRAAP